MALKIFISSVYRELHKERQALHEEILKLQDLFVGMEFFGSDPAKPADYCVRQVEDSDLYVGLFGDDYGSVDEASGMSFTRLEYEAAAARQIPCLIYFKASAGGGVGGDERLAALKATLREKHIVYLFKDVGDLKLQFLIDFIKLLRSTLFDKIIPLSRGPIPADALLSLTKGFMREQIEYVGKDKYISEVYVTREVEKDVARFTHFEATFRERAATILEYMDSIRVNYALGDRAALAVSRARVSLDDVRRESIRAALDELKQAFYFREVEEALEAFNSLIMEPSDERFDIRSRQQLLSWRGKPFVNQGQLRGAYEEVFHERTRSLPKQALQTDLTYRRSLRLFPSHAEDNVTIHLANNLIKELTTLAELSLKRCLVLVDKAGTGKTNVSCRVAEQLTGEHPVVLLSGQMALSSEYDIEAHIKWRLESAFSGMFSDWMNRVSPGLQAARKWLFIIIDGINENSQRPLFIQLLKGLLPRLEERRVKVILTCRDLFWDVFRDTLEPYLFDGVVPLHEFTEAEWHRAVEAYFERFNVKCSLDKEAREALRNPLLLRFFCEAHHHRDLGRVRSLRLVSVFRLYVERTGRGISERHNSLKPDSALNFLLALAHEMWERRSLSVSPTALRAELLETGGGGSIYDLLLSENIILEEARHTYSTRKSVRFLYDEFMEYMIAQSWADEISDSADSGDETSRLIQEAVESLGSFPPTLGAVLFLDKMLERGGSLVNEFIVRASRLGDPFLSSHQTSLIYAFESINFADADDELIAAVEKLEPLVREDLRERLTSVIIKIAQARPDNQYVRAYIHQVLEVGRNYDAPAAAEGALDDASPTVKPKENWWRAGGVKKEKEKEAKGEEKEKELPRLPPGRHHYSEENKVNAIGILVQMKDPGEYANIGEGIRKLGRTDLHSALEAWQYLDLAGDELVYKTVAAYMDVSQPEYRIYCAWLLRGRYGSEPANYLARLLTDRETRVHQYAAGLFERRLVERELIEIALTRVGESTPLKPWHLKHFIRLLAMRDSFHPRGTAEVYGARIVGALAALLGHPQASIRLEAYRALAEHPSSIGLDVVRRDMGQDSDRGIRSLADKLAPRA